MKKVIRFLQKNLGEYLERLLLILFGVGLGVKIIVVNHNIDPRALNLDMMVADYILVIFAPLAVVALNIIYARMIGYPDEPAPAGQDQLNEILEDVVAEPIEQLQ